MDLEAPTFNSLNTAQKRALILRDQLRWFDPQHLDSFIDGLANPEPPDYKNINGVTTPDLVFVKLKASASRFELGNVIFPEENHGVLHAYLIFEHGKIEMHTEEALAESEQSLDHVAIHGFIARTMVEMFKKKIGMIMARISILNEARRSAYSSPPNSPVCIASGEVRQFIFRQSKQVCRLLREPNTPVTPHITNTRPVAGLCSIPASLKAATFAAVPEQTKIDLFNNIASAAFPNFDNLMVASWNVVSVYSACGSDFPEMHKAVVELKDVLQDFDSAFGATVSRTPVQYRSDWAGEGRMGGGVARPLRTEANIDKSPTGAVESSEKAVQELPSQDQDSEMMDREGEQLSDTEQDLPAPALSHQDEDSPSESEIGEDDAPALRPSDPHVRQRYERRKPTNVEPEFLKHVHTSSEPLPLRTPPSAPPPAHPTSSQSKIIRIGDKKSQVLRNNSPAPIEEGHPAPINAIAATPRAITGVESLPLVTKTSPAQGANVPALTPAAAPSTLSAIASPSAAPIASPTINKRKASGSPTPGTSKKKLISDLSTAQVQEKARTTRTEILRKWKCFDPDVVPRPFLGLHHSLQAELERRGHGEASASSSRIGSSSNAQQAHGRVRTRDQEDQEHTADRIAAGRSTERAPAELQKRIEERNRERERERGTPCRTSERPAKRSTEVVSRHSEGSPAEARPVVTGMFGAYLGKSMLGAKKSIGIAPVAPMFGTEGSKNNGGGRSGSGTGGAAGNGSSGSGNDVDFAESGRRDRRG
ncbi:hypothetical protein IAQ61_012079 [Plenodomus lingam]|uniref:uncharacterized protein n=1 Tax=Leptosphaeria maculans TaxID=5022 RepID=UPI003333ABF0|nr:hypothetical protein IAQ61_012079 [Plenodomus lingam]